ncbi:unnamed protein product [Brassica napus]|uniref:(rape) hypothetical protein n=1 Tax=Brassica napus TaxID=3708 RepID=A0A816S9N8_BRANA|nr:unnamed protein product [Brassica napus]
MSSNRQRNTNSRRPTNSNQTAEDSTPPAEATLRNKDKYKWSYIQEKTLIQLFDEAVALDDYTLKNPSAIGREYMRWKTLMSFTGISVDPDTSMIYASEAWWKEREVGCKLTKSLNRKPPIFWEVMVRCFALHDVQSQSQHSARQRREELINTRLVDEEVDDGSDTDSGDRPQTQPQEMEEEEVYRVIVDDGTHHLNEDTNETVRRCHQRGRQNVQSSARRGTTSHRLGETSRVPLRGGSRGNRRRQSFETTIQDTIAGYTEFQRQSLQQLRPAGSIDEDNQQWGTPPTAQQWGIPPFSQQWGTPPNAQQWGTPPSGPARTNPTTVQYGFSVGSEEESVRNAQENNAAVGTSPNDNAGHTSHTPRPGGLFNIWGTSININESHQNYSEDED